MNKRLSALALCITLLLSASVFASAAGPEAAGFYNLGSDARTEIVPLSETGAPVSPVAQNVDGIDGDEVFYPGSRSLRVTLSGTEAGKQYLLTVSAADTVLYADQQDGGGAVTFYAAFRLPEVRTELTLRVGSDAGGFAPVSVSLSYTPEPSDGPAPSPKPSSPQEYGYADCKGDESCVLSAYSDLDAAAWYHDGVHYALETGLMNGVGDGRFAPASPASRAMLVTMLWRMEGEPVVNYAMSFADVAEDSWCAEAVRWAASEHIVDGYSAERFGPNDRISREQLCTILWRYAKYQGSDKLAESGISLGVFIDAEHISPWALDGLRWAVGAGLISGVSDEKLSPETNASRAQVATVLMRMESL